MSRQTKKVLSIFAAAALCASAVSVSAAEWKLTGYETSDAGISPFYQESALIYQEFDDSGIATGRQVSGKEAWAEGLRGYGKVTFMNPWVDRTFPNKEYAKMYVDGEYSGRVFETGRFGKDVVNYRNANYMWEAAAPYKIFSKTQAYLADGWYTDASYPAQYSAQNATVVKTRPHYGFGDYEIVGNNDVRLVPEALKAYRDPNYASVNGALTIADLNPSVEFRAIEFNGKLEVPCLYDLVLAGPTFNYDGTIADEFGLTLTASKTNAASLANFNVANLLSTERDSFTGDFQYAVISWTDGGFEIAPPHKMYQFLTVDGVVMDGSYIPGTAMRKPYIYRYTGNANPAVTWVPEKVVQNGYGNEVVLRRYVDGKIDADDVTGLKNSGIFTNPEYYEVIDAKTATKSLEAVYRFFYNGSEYALDSSDNLLVVDWSSDVATKTFIRTAPLAPYVAE